MDFLEIVFPVYLQNVGSFDRWKIKKIDPFYLSFHLVRSPSGALTDF